MSLYKCNTIFVAEVGTQFSVLTKRFVTVCLKIKKEQNKLTLFWRSLNITAVTREHYVTITVIKCLFNKLCFRGVCTRNFNENYFYRFKVGRIYWPYPLAVFHFRTYSSFSINRNWFRRVIVSFIVRCTLFMWSRCLRFT